MSHSSSYNLRKGKLALRFHSLDRHVVANGKSGNSWADGMNDSGCFVPHDQGIGRGYFGINPSLGPEGNLFAGKSVLSGEQRGKGYKHHCHRHRYMQFG